MPILDFTLDLSASRTENIYVGNEKEVCIKAFKKDSTDMFVLKQFNIQGQQDRKTVNEHYLKFNTKTYAFVIIEYNGLDSIRFEISYS